VTKRVAGLHPSEYVAAAEARWDEALHLEEQQRYALAIYVAGVAVECMLRAYWPKHEPFDEKHDLRGLAQRSDFYPSPTHPSYDNLADAVQAMVRLWQNRFRYWTDPKLQKEFRADYTKAKGNLGALKSACHDVVAAATEIVRFGVVKWRQAKKP